jgi:transposase
MITTIDLGGSMVDHGTMKAYSEDLRRRKVVEAVEQRGTSKSEAARLFSISLSSLKRYARLADREESPLPPGREAEDHP